MKNIILIPSPRDFGITTRPCRRALKSKLVASIALAAALATAGAAPALAADPDPQAQGASLAQGTPLAQAQWRDGIAKIPTPGRGCFQATFPSNLWLPATCGTIAPRTHPLPRRPRHGQPQTTGNGNDYALVANGLITQAVGSFPAVSGVTSESSVGVPAFGNGGILGPNEYTLQLNTNADASTAACAGGDPTCLVWQQFVYATDYVNPGSAALFMQYWLINYGASGAACPANYYAYQLDCYANSDYISPPDAPITDLANLKLSASVVLGGSDTITFANGPEAYSVSAPDSLMDIAAAWRQAEFNVLGDAGGAEAQFNVGASVTVNVAAEYGSTATAGCASNAGTTGETNNLDLGPCIAVGGAMPSIQFTEALSAVTGDTLLPGQSLTSGQFVKSQNGQFELILQNDGNLVLYDLTTGWALWASNTYGQSVAICVMQLDGNLVLYSPSGAAVWASNTSGNPGAYLVVQNDANTVIYASNDLSIWSTDTYIPQGIAATGSVMAAGQVLDSGQFILSPSGRFELVQQDDGNLVLYDLLRGRALWSSQTNGKPVAVAIMQADGNLVQYEPGGKAEWASNTSGNPGAYLVLQNDGNVVVYRGNGSAAWATNTVR